MRSSLFALVFINIFICVLCFNKTALIEFAVKQYSKAIKTINTGIEYPHTGLTDLDHWNISTVSNPGASNANIRADTGFYAGILWYLYNLTNDAQWKNLAIKASDGLAFYQNKISNHDIGFMMMTTYGRELEFTKNESAAKIIVNAAHHFATRFNAKVGCTRSWDAGKPEFTVIEDNMMNLELLFEGWRLSGNKTLYDMAVSHTNRTIIEHIRPDYGSYHIVAFNETDGSVIRKYTTYGYSTESTWSQGQAWLVAGLTIAYRYTKMAHILKAAEGVSDYFIRHAPNDSIPPWDYDVPHDDKHKYIPRDSAAAAIAASGLIELYSFTKNKTYLDHVNSIIDSLSSDAYRADGKPQYKIPALIVNGTTNASPARSSPLYDTAMALGDYYFIESIARYNF